MKNKMILRNSFTHLKQACLDWRTKNGITDAASDMPASFPVPESLVRNETWNKFRAQFLAEWINGDAAAYREIAGDRAYIAVDYLDANEAEQFRRDGDPAEFLSALIATTTGLPNASSALSTTTGDTGCNGSKPLKKRAGLKQNKIYNMNWLCIMPDIV